MSAFDRKEKSIALALALATGMTHKAAAEQFGISERTIRRKLNQPTFRRLLAQCRNQYVSQALGRLTEHLTSAVDVLAESLADDDPTIRIRAARTMLTHADRLRDSVEVSDRIRELEYEVKAKLGAEPCPSQPD